MTYLAIDPGHTTGWATFDEEGVFTGLGKITGEDKFLDWLETQVKENKPRLVIIEQYRNRPGTAVNSWSTGPTQQHIGAITRILRKAHVQMTMQDPSPALSIGLRFIGMHTLYEGKHVPDDVSAYAHGTYYLRRSGIQKP